MKTSVKLWLRALRSGKYKQTREYLHTDSGYCCLGVACEIYNKTHKSKVNYKGPLDEESLNDPKVAIVARWLGLEEGTGQFMGETNHSSLADLNDKGQSFKEIADLIESNPKKLFEDDRI